MNNKTASEYIIENLSRRDKRTFVICPKCKGTNINYGVYTIKISYYHKHEKYNESVKVLGDSAFTVCNDCGFKKERRDNMP
jgi:predicted Zn-ribbon and HTH transcriptional regulator